MKHTAYPEYKESGVPWLGEVPAHWEVKRLKYGFKLITEKTDSDENPIALENVESWTGRYIDSVSSYDNEGSSFDAGDILFGKLRPYLAKVFLAEKNGVSHGEFFILRNNENCFSRYYSQLLRTAEYINVIDGSTFGAKMPRVSWDFMGKLLLPLPPLPEQQAIAAFLDRKTGRIDALIEKKQHLIELLQEQRTALITRAVTRGLDESVPFKDSGVPWLGQVPAHWEVKKLKYVASITTGYAFNSDDYIDDGVPLIRIGDINKNGSISIENAKKVPEEFIAKYPSVVIKKNDILMAMTGATIGKAGKYSNTVEGLLNQRVCKFISESISQSNLWYILKSAGYIEHVNLTGFGGAQPNISDSELLTYSVAVPTLYEQKIIIDYLDRKTSQIDSLIKKIMIIIEKLQEYRTALISAAVTGKIDVRGDA